MASAVAIGLVAPHENCDSGDVLVSSAFNARKSEQNINLECCLEFYIYCQALCTVLLTEVPGKDLRQIVRNRFPYCPDQR